MAKNPQTAEKLMTDLVPAATAKARDEAARIQKMIDAEKGGFELAPAGLGVTTRRRCAKPSTISTNREVKPYFELDRVLQDGVFFAADKLYGITFKERKDIPVYQPDVRVSRRCSTPTASRWRSITAITFKRDNKSGGAWM